jgi:two-component system NtrC family sensor kinase
MTALPPDVLADLNQLVAELEQRLESTFAAHDAAIAQQAAATQENVRLQSELDDAHNREKEALERQTATAEILKVIASSPSDTTPVFDAIAISANRLLGGFSAAVFRFVDGTVHLAAFTPVSPAADAALKADFPRAADEFEPFQLAQQARPFPIPDTEQIPYVPIRDIARVHGFRSMLFVPLMNGDDPIGIISVARLEAGAFSPSHVQLLQTFADQAVIAIENARLFNETREALERQTATADILKVIAGSQSDVQPVFEAIAASANRLIGGFSSAVFRFVDELVYLAAFTPTHSEADKTFVARFPQRLSEGPLFKRATGGETVSVDDTESGAWPGVQNLARARGFRSLLLVPLMRSQTAIGAISVTRVETGTFSEHHVRLLQTFADQAVIAIENARLFDEVRQRTDDLSESLQQQTATGDVLKVIASSPTDVRPVLDAIVKSACELCEAHDALVFLGDAAELRSTAHHGPIPEGTGTIPIQRGWAAGRAFLDREPVHVGDMLSDEGNEFPEAQELCRRMGHRTMLSVPMLREGESIGVIMLRRNEVRPFNEKQIALLQTFADQAVIAIGNVQLFDEVQARTRDLSESLQQQTATADVLKVISRSAFDLQTVLDTLTKSAALLCNADMASISRQYETGFQHVTNYNFPPDWVDYTKSFRMQAGRGSIVGRALQDGKVVQVVDVMADPEYTYLEPQQKAGYRTFLSVPMLREGLPIGVLSLCRKTVEPFTSKQIELVSTFSDQAVIAIENVRLFDEVQAKTRDLSEALTYQTGSGNILRVIASSPTDVKPVLTAIVESACELCEADDALATLRDGDELVFQAQHGSIPVVWERQPIDREGAAGLAVINRAPVHVHDLLAPEGEQFPRAREFARTTNVRTVLCVPLLREGEGIGAIVLRRTEVRPFSDKQISLLQTFADQAVIAIGNVRLFEQVQQRTRELAASLDELRTAQDRLVQTEKLASLGQLTAGIAHEIKNPLNFVNNFAALSAELTDELNDVLKPAALADKIREEVDELTGLLKDNLEKVVQHGKRADSIVKNMLLHSREGSGDHRSADINALIDESLNLAYHGARAEKPDFNVTLQRDFDSSAGTVEVFPQEITRVFLNLVSNGFYAVAKRKTGDPGFDPVLSAATRDLGDSVEIRIRDNGTGIPPEVKDKMFNPFFTTKPAGEGTGLGLSMSHDIIVKQHGGTIDVETEPGQFTEFRIVLPRASTPPNKNRGRT